MVRHLMRPIPETCPDKIPEMRMSGLSGWQQIGQHSHQPDINPDNEPDKPDKPDTRHMPTQTRLGVYISSIYIPVSGAVRR